MPSGGAADRPGDSAQGLSGSSSFRLALNCPSCGVPGEVEYRKLVRGLRCHNCQKEFAVVRGGRVVSFDDLPQVSYSCPRCGKAGKLPAIFANSRASCGRCGLPLAKGPDQRLHSVEEAENLRRSAQIAEKQAREQQLREWNERRDGLSPQAIRRIKQGLAGGAVFVLLFLALAIKLYVVDAKPAARAVDFTRTCLAGNWNRAAKFFEDDAVQQLEFDRWRMRHFSSILDKYRPSGDSVYISVEAIADEPTRKLFHVTMESEFLGSRSVDQSWRLIDGRWQFDSRATMAHESRSAGKSTPGRRIMRPKIGARFQ